MASALWHGIYPGYAITFFGGAMHDILSKHMERIAGEKVVNSLPYKLVSIIFTAWVLSYWGANFMVLSWSNCKII